MSMPKYFHYLADVVRVAPDVYAGVHGVLHAQQVLAVEVQPAPRALGEVAAVVPDADAHTLVAELPAIQLQPVQQQRAQVVLHPLRLLVSAVVVVPLGVLRRVLGLLVHGPGVVVLQERDRHQLQQEAANAAQERLVQLALHHEELEHEDEGPHGRQVAQELVHQGPCFQTTGLPKTDVQVDLGFLVAHLHQGYAGLGHHLDEVHLATLPQGRL
mmetsp:Transcript_14562/g.21432  ORF Transcript_14562/g.21432 Transcript_14562/m.21432 type:complete len:214 (-) Transcript_14562:430-1071(-)